MQFAFLSRDYCFACNGRAWKVDSRAQALVGPGLATPLAINRNYIHIFYLDIEELGNLCTIKFCIGKSVLDTMQIASCQLSIQMSVYH